LAGNTPGLPDGTFLLELFLQRLPANVQMVLASTRDGTSIEGLTQLADKVVEVAVPPSMSNVSAPVQSSEIQQPRAEQPY